MRISDWSSDVCSSDLLDLLRAVESGVGLTEHVRRAGHMLDATRDEQVGIAGADRLGGRPDGVKARAAQAVDSAARHLLRSSEERREGKECVRTGRSRWSPST